MRILDKIESNKIGKESRLAEKSEASQSGRLKEKRADLSESRGDSRSKKNGGSKKPKQKQRLKFAYEETGASMKSDRETNKLNQMDADGVNFRHQKQKEKAKKFSYEEAKKKKEAKQHSKKVQVYQANEGEAPGKKKSRLKFGEGELVKTEKTSVAKKAGSATSAALHREISKNEDDNAAVEGAHKLEESGEGAVSYTHLDLPHLISQSFVRSCLTMKWNWIRSETGKQPCF